MAIKINGDNTVANPGFSGDDTDTGLQVGTNELKLVTGGTARATVDSSGRMGIGSASPEDPLHIKSNSGAIRLENTVVSNNDSTIAYDNTDLAFHVDPNNVRGSSNITFSGDGNERMRLDSNGRLGIGTNAPDVALDVVGEAIVGNGTYGVKLTYSNNNTSGIVDTGNSADKLEFRVQNSEKMRLTSAGRLGIGTDDPDRTLHVAGSFIRVDDGYGLDSSGSTEKVVLDNGFISLTTSSTERLRVQSNGGFRVSTNRADSDYYTGGDAYHLLHLNTDGLAALIVEHSGNTTPNGIAIDLSDASPDNNSQYFLRCLDVSGNRLYIWSDGDIDNHDNSYGAISDVKLKQDIVDAGSQWDDLKDLRVRNFKFKSDVAAYGDEAKTLIGLVAQEVETVSPGLVKESPDVDDDGNDLGTVTKSIRYSVLYMKAVKALQEAMERIETLETQNADLTARITALETA